MKRTLSIFMAAALSVALTGCAASSTPTPKASAQISAPAVTESAIPSEATSPTSPKTSGTGTKTAPPTEKVSTVIYKNNDFGFTFKLPAGWSGYSIVNSDWQGNSIDQSGSETVSQTGPQISIRNPKWTSAAPYQDIPIMVFTLSQWASLQNDEFHIGAAPIGPSELGRNTAYVFALPARYNFQFLPGYEEVETILNGSPLKANNDYSKKK